VPAPVPLPPVAMSTITENLLKSDSTSCLDSSKAALATSGLCMDPNRRVVTAPIRSRSSFGTSNNENSLVSRNRVVTARRSRSAYFELLF
jgi:hypothetical protein